MESSSESSDSPGTPADDSLSVESAPLRPETEIFSELEALCTSPGYVYALAVLNLTNNAILYKEKLKPEDLIPSYSWSRLIRSELSTLFGLMLKRPVSYDFQGDEVTATYIDRTLMLMEELHRAIDSPGKAAVLEVLKSGKDPGYATFEALQEERANTSQCYQPYMRMTAHFGEIAKLSKSAHYFRSQSSNCVSACRSTCCCRVEKHGQ